MKVYKTLLGFPDSGSLFSCDTIEYQGDFWLVPEWNEAPELGLRKPVRIISIQNLPHQKMPESWDQHFVLNEPMSRDVFEGRCRPAEAHKYIVVEGPDIEDHFPASGLQ